MEKKTIKKPKRAISRKPEPVDLDSMPLDESRSQSAPLGKKTPTAVLTPYAERLLARSNGSAVPASAALSGEWLQTAMAAKLTGYSRRHIVALCDQGFFIEGREWKQRPPCPGMRQGGRIWIRRSALKRLETEW